MIKKNILIDITISLIFIGTLYYQYISLIIPFYLVIVMFILITIRLYFNNKIGQKKKKYSNIIYLITFIMIVPTMRIGVYTSNYIKEKEIINNIKEYENAVEYIKTTLLIDQYPYQQIVYRKGVEFDEINKNYNIHDKIEWDRYEPLAFIVHAGRDSDNIITIEFFIDRKWGVPSSHSILSIIYQSSDKLDDRYKKYHYIRHFKKCWFSAIPQF